MRAIAGAILILAGVIGYSFARLLEKAEWWKSSGQPGGGARAIELAILSVPGAVFVLCGIAIMIWGFRTDRTYPPQ